MKKTFFALLLLVLLPLVGQAQTKKTAVLFYADWCPHCQKVENYFNSQGFFEKYDIVRLNFDDPTNKKLLADLFADQGRKGGAGIPAIVVDNQMLVGDQPIIDGFQMAIEQSSGRTQNYLDSVKSGRNKVPLFVLIGAAFVDAANPCALAVLILLLATVISAKGKNRALLSGLMFSLAIFLSYLMMGLGAYKAIALAGVSKYLSLGVGALAILIALANFKDVFWYGKWFIMEVPLSWRPRMQAIIKSATSPWSAFGIGLLVSLFLVPCASGPYVVILGMLAEKVEMAKTISLLLLYNLVFVLPMLLITFGMYFFNVRMGKLEKLRQENLRLLHAVAGTIMFLVGIYLIYTRI